MRGVESRMAHLADRLRHRRSEFFDNVRARSERVAEPFRVRWYRFTDSVGVRWEELTGRYRARRERVAEPLRVRWYRFTDSVGVRWEGLTGRYRARRERVTEGLWVGWEGFLDSVGVRWERLADRSRARRERLPGDRAEQFRQSAARRASAILGASLCVVLMVTIAVLIRVRTAPPAPPNAASVKPSLPAVRGIDVPNVRGMPASDARAELEGAGLKFAGARAALGAPGQVLWTQPNIGRSVPPDTPVTIVIGVEAERLGSASPVALARA